MRSLSHWYRQQRLGSPAQGVQANGRTPATNNQDTLAKRSVQHPADPLTGPDTPRQA